MKVGRWLGVIVLLSVTALGMVLLRERQRSCVHEIIQSQQERIAMRRELWTLQMSVARLRTPQRIKGHLDQWLFDGPSHNRAIVQNDR